MLKDRSDQGPKSPGPKWPHAPELTVSRCGHRCTHNVAMMSSEKSPSVKRATGDCTSSCSVLSSTTPTETLLRGGESIFAPRRIFYFYDNKIAVGGLISSRNSPTGRLSNRGLYFEAPQLFLLRSFAAEQHFSLWTVPDTLKLLLHFMKFLVNTTSICT